MFAIIAPPLHSLFQNRFGGIVRPNDGCLRNLQQSAVCCEFYTTVVSHTPFYPARERFAIIQRLEAMGMRRLAVLALSGTALFSVAVAQTFSTCNPLTTTGCSPNPALGRSESIDFTQGPSDLFDPQGDPTYGPDGLSLTVRQQGDAPQLNSKFYIMFGKLEVSLKAAPGAGIVSSVVLQSDVLDEIDWEWLGAGPDEVQTNYFGKGQTLDYNRGAFHPDPGSQETFKTYTIDWTADQIVWQIDGSTVRAMTPDQAATGQYPQTPMQVKIGAWSGGDPSNAPGTIAWARGPTDYSQGPYSMMVKAVVVTDYSTGTQYRYNGQDGSWQSIEVVGGTVNSSGSGSGGSGSAVSIVEAPAVTETKGMPVPFSGTHRDTTRVVETPGLGDYEAGAAATSYPGLPAGWTVTSDGKVLPPSSASHGNHAPYSSSPSLASSASIIAAEAGGRVTTSFDQRGFPTVITVPSGASTIEKSFDERGFLITATPNADAEGDVGDFTALKATAAEVPGVAPGGPRRPDAGLIIGALSGLLGGIMLLWL
ncbi:MAG: hypothetical protein M1815_005326 [Lichina confinis]|nr:MAG: hypothetical protein M1815_005326 [Lichina confinis]